MVICRVCVCFVFLEFLYRGHSLLLASTCFLKNVTLNQLLLRILFCQEKIIWPDQKLNNSTHFIWFVSKSLRYFC